jgi:hypothetical protein
MTVAGPPAPAPSYGDSSKEANAPQMHRALDAHGQIGEELPLGYGIPEDI